MTRACLTPSALKYGLENMSGLWSPIPITGIGSGTGVDLAAPAGAAATTAASRAEKSSARRTSALQQDRVVVGVRGRAAAQQHQRLGAVVAQLVRGPRRDHDGVPGPHLPLVV